MKFFLSASRWLLLGCLVYSPWAYGSTRPWTITILQDWLLLCFILHVLGLFLLRRRPSYPALPTACILLLLAQSLWMYFNARYYFDPAFEQFVPLHHPYPALPGSWDKAATLFALQTQAAMAAAFFMAFDLVSSARWKRRLWLTIGLTGLSIVLFGLSQRAFQAPSIFWLHEKTGNTFFAGYQYHANAGAFLNLIWPVLATLLIQSWRKKDANIERAFWYTALFLGMAACLINVSRGANAITLLLLPLAFLWFLPRIQRYMFQFSTPIRILALIIIAIFIAVAVWGDARAQAKMRWDKFDTEFTTNNQRLLVDEACLKIIPKAGWLGYGPGTFSMIFPFNTLYLGERLWGFWRFAHEDYLQTVIEYGYVGAFLWGLLLFGSLFIALRRGFQPSVRTSDSLMFQATTLALTSVALHSLVDFPLQIASIQLYVTVFLAIAWHQPDFQIKIDPEAPPEN